MHSWSSSVYCSLAVCLVISLGGCSSEKEPTPGIVKDDDVTITSAADMAALVNVSQINGRLSVKRVALTELSLPKLRVVKGKLFIQKNAKLKKISLPALEQVGSAIGDDLIIERNPRLEEISLNALTSVFASVRIRENHFLNSINLEKLTDSGTQGLHIIKANKLRFLFLPSLRTARNLVIENNHWLEEAVAGSLSNSAFIQIKNNPLLHKLVFDDLLYMDTDPNVSPGQKGLIIENNGNLSTLAGFQNLQRIGRPQPVRIAGNKKLHGCMGHKLVDRLKKHNWTGKAIICGNLKDACDLAPCPE